MAIRFTKLTDATAPAARELVMSVWDQDADDSFAGKLFEWRYRARPAGETELAFDDDRCIGIIDSLARPYLHDGHVTTVRETCDWFCLPRYRPLGIGAALMRRLMARPEPIVSIGGSKRTLALLLRLKWQRLADVREYVLPLTARMLAVWGLRGLKFGTGTVERVPSAIPFRSLHDALRPGPGARVEPLADRGGAAYPLPGGHALAELLDDDDRDWLSAAPGRIGELIGLQFTIDGAPVGISLGRVEPYAFGTAGKILHLQVADLPQKTIGWIVAETARRLVDRRVEMLFCRASCPRIGRALRDAGFFSVQARAAYWWPAGGASLAGTTHLTYLRADDAVPFDELRGPRAAPGRHVAPGERTAARDDARWRKGDRQIPS